MNPINMLAEDLGLMRNGRWCLTSGHIIGLAIGSASIVAGLLIAVMGAQ